MQAKDEKEDRLPEKLASSSSQYAPTGSLETIQGRVSAVSVSPARGSSGTIVGNVVCPPSSSGGAPKSPLSQSMSGKAVLKVFCSKSEQTSYRTFQFDATTTVRDALQGIRKKYNIDSPDFGLFVEPKTDCKSIDKNERGLWLDEGKMISDYVSTQLHLKSKVRPLKVACLDYDSTKTLMIDETQVVQDLIPAIAKRFGVQDPAEYSVQVRLGDAKSPMTWVDTSKTLCEQGIYQQDLIFRKKFFVTDFYFDPADTATLHLIYLEAKHAVINSLFPCKFEQLVYFAALQMQITYGNYDPLVHVAGFLPLSDFLPPSCADVQFVEEDIYKSHRRLKDLGKTEAQARYVKLCFSFPTYGVTYVRAKEASVGSNSVDHEFLIGVNSDSLLSLQSDTKAILARTSLTDIDNFTAKGRIVTCQFTSGKFRKLILFADQDAQLLIDLIGGYIAFRKSKRKETFAQKVFSRHTARASPFRSALLSPKIRIKGHSPFVSGRPESASAALPNPTVSSSNQFRYTQPPLSTNQFPENNSYVSRLPESKQEFLLNPDRPDPPTFTSDGMNE